ncbi:peptidoglycan DD-metalloendopeptidase family protein [Paenibacillus sp. GD4]|uniref:M23 family metallopeptidase n=1 Tax=Paenibacillus sp. GD4 TaxID=3068890 RepID=UPI002796B62F|nr:M23 family metallopeptidase [Paenibacillus sp. GD4]MDQ1910650.1 peptidoglycan DD-metalloendopeptidase family protein [Paenibacillus sp. GD4]
MNYKWFQSKLTFVIIPEVNGSVVRVKLSRAAIWGTVITAALLVIASLFVYFHYAHTAATAYWWNAELSGQNEQLEKDLDSKNATIEQLKNDIFSLSKQAEEVRSKVEQMKQLEDELKKLSPGAEAAISQGQADAGGSALAGMGGPAVSVTTQETKALASATEASYAALGAEMAELEARFAESRRVLMEKRERLQHTPSLWPTVSRIVTSNYGYRKDPIHHKLSFHRGIDIAGKMNDPVYASGSGTVHTASYDKLHGNHVILEHGSGLRTWYMHLNSLDVKQGDKVVKGQTIGRLGTTGRSTGPHLHYEVIQGGKATDPKPYLPANATKS